jgi:hypothetical protein
MSQDPDALANSIMTLNGMAASFDGLVESVLLELRAMMGVPPQIVDEVVESEFRLVAQRLRRFRPLYDRHCAELLVKHIAPTQLPEVAEALRSPTMQGYFQALRAMRPETTRLTQALAAAMKDVALHEKPEAAPAVTDAPGTAALDPS